MKIKVLGCYASEGILTNSDGCEINCKTTGFLINDCVLIDAGTISNSLDLPGMARIQHIVLSHIHFDHIKGLPFLADNVFGKIQKPIEVHSIGEVLEGLHDHPLNDLIWPDFTKLPNEDSPIFRLSQLQEEEDRQVGELRIMAIRVNHVVPTVGFLLQDHQQAFLYSGDTHETKRIWEVATKQAKLSAVFIETSFPNDLYQLAVDSGHLTPELLGQEFKKIGRPDIPLYVYHMKPQYINQIEKEIRSLKIPNVILLKDGLSLTL